MLRLLSWMLFFVSGLAYAQDCAWPAWQQFRQELISADGRVIDYSSEARITTSEGQSYAMFFALVANDRVTFDSLLDWTANNLTPDGLEKALPAWSWGRNEEQWVILDSNNASDADLWMAYSLLEAGRIWKDAAYSELGVRMLWRSAAGSVRNLPGLGLMLLPADKGFEPNGQWRLNPSYLPLQILERFTQIDGVWREIAANSITLLRESAPLGYAPDWVDWTGQGVEFTGSGSKGSYDAIRVYLWLGMLPENFPQRSSLLKHFQPMATYYLQHGKMPEAVDVQSGEFTGEGPAGFRAALLPYLMTSPEQPGVAELLAVGRKQLQQPAEKTAYYNQVLSLFTDGWLQGFYRFDKNGFLHRTQKGGVCQ